MKRKLKIALLILGTCAVLFVGLGFVLAWLGNRKLLRANQLPDVAYRAITSDSSLVLMSLDPKRIQPAQPEAGFHGYRVLGQTTVTDSVLRTRLAETLRRGLATWQLGYPMCFNPRHGIRAVFDGQRHDFVICFECGELRYYPPDGSDSSFHGFGEGTVPGPFADILTAANVPTSQIR